MISYQQSTSNSFESVSMSLDVASFSGSDALLLTLIAKGVMAGFVHNSNGRSLELCAKVKQWDLPPHEFALLAELVSLASGTDQEVATTLAKESVASYWTEYLKEFVNDAELLNDVYGPEHYGDGLRELREAVREALEETGFVFDASEVTSICKKLDMNTIAERNIERQQD